MQTESQDPALQELRSRLAEISNLSSARSVLSWDQMTYMPEKGAGGRGSQIATLDKVIHEKQTNPKLGELISQLAKLPDSHDDAALVRVADRDYQRAKKLPDEFVTRVSEHTSALYQIWTKARPDNDVAAVLPGLEKSIELSRRYSDYIGNYDHPCDPHMDESDEGMTAAKAKALFDELSAVLVPLVKAIGEKPAPDDAFLFESYPVDEQIEFGKWAIERLGFDFSGGRQDFTHHPFMTRFSAGDVRITTRAKENDFGDAFFSTVHEAGHAMYEQGVAPELDATPLGGGVSAGVHESQSRLWENIVGRSEGFWKFAFASLQERFPRQLAGVAVEDFYRAINKVTPSLVRVDADEVTYNLHVMIRVGLEMDLLDGKLAAKDAPDAWHAAYEEKLGVRAPDHRDGILQDVHWYVHTIGGTFQGYTLGNVMSGQFYAAAVAAHPTIPAEIEQGRFETLRTWLTDNVYRHGRRHRPLDLVEQATGKSLSVDDFRAYLQNKYRPLYEL